MKNIPELRFPEFSGEWVEKRLGEVCESFSGGTPSRNKKDYFKGNIPFIKSGEISKEKTEEKITKEALKNSSAKLVKKGDLLVALYGATSGEVAISKIKGAINQAVLCLRCEIEEKFLFYWFEFNKKRIITKYTQGGQPNLSAQIIKSLKIHIPESLEEQQKIANFLSSIDKKIDIISKKIENLKEYKKGLLQKLLNVKNGVPELRFPEFSGEWVEKRLGEVGNIKYGKGQNEIKNKIGNFPIIGTGGILGTSGEYLYDKESIILGRKGTIDKPIYINKPFWCVDTTFFFEFYKEYVPKFIFYLLNKINWKIYNESTGVPSLSSNTIKKIKIHIPPTIEEQQKIAEFLSLIDEKIELNEQKLTKLKEYKRGLLQKMFV